MSTSFAFRSVVELVYLNTRPHKSPIFLPLPALGFRNIAPARPPYRHLHTSVPRGAWVKNNQPSRPAISKEAEKTKARKAKEIGLKDNFIPYEKVQVSTPEGLSFRPLKDVIAEIDSLNSLEERGKRYHAVLVVNDPDPIVKIVDFKAEYNKKKKAQERAKASAAQKVRKEVQLSWASSEADVETKLEKVKGDLEKGFKVDMVITGKGSMRRLDRDEQTQRVQQLVTRLQGIAKEWKERDFTQAAVVVYLQGIAEMPVVDEGDKKAEKAALRQQRREAQEERLRKKQELEARSRSDAYEIPIP
jgi:translation initiation factor IF-3